LFWGGCGCCGVGHGFEGQGKGWCAGGDNPSQPLEVLQGKTAYFRRHAFLTCSCLFSLHLFAAAHRRWVGASVRLCAMARVQP
jgi:hypothetical protein